MTPDPAAMDARVLAARLLQALQQGGNGPRCMAYGTARQVLLGIGCETGLLLDQTLSLDDVWSGIDRFIDHSRGQYIFGFIGFDPGNLLRRPAPVPQRKTGLFIPETVLSVDGTGFQVLKGTWTFGAPGADAPEYQPLDPQSLDTPEYRAHYHAAVKDLLDAIERGELERATLARRIDTSLKFDLVYTFLSDRSEHRQSRSFYFCNDHIRFAGQSPELLAEGTTWKFATHKLSGAWPRGSDPDLDEQIIAFSTDPRIHAEHESSTRTIEKSLTGIGHCSRSPAKVMTLPTLLHGWSEFTTRPVQPVTIADCLRAVFPFGVDPLDAGMAAIASHEKDCRGPYYGLTGVIEPGGEFSFTQVLRTAFEDERGCYLMAGAAITPNSTPELETAETCNKLSGIGLATAPVD
jgi:anthranilate/para-aminobenzoate synthase component I